MDACGRFEASLLVCTSSAICIAPLAESAAGWHREVRGSLEINAQAEACQDHPPPWRLVQLEQSQRSELPLISAAALAGTSAGVAFFLRFFTGFPSGPTAATASASSALRFFGFEFRRSLAAAAAAAAVPSLGALFFGSGMPGTNQKRTASLSRPMRNCVARRELK